MPKDPKGMRKIRDHLLIYLFIYFFFVRRIQHNILLAMYAADIYQNTVLPKHTQDRKRYCMELSTDLFQDVSAQLYLTSNSIVELRKQDRTISGVFKLLRTDLIRGFNSGDWIEDNDKILLVDKANKLKVALGTSISDCIHPQVLSKKYHEVSMKINENFAENLLLLMEHRKKSVLSLAGSTFNQGQM